MPKLDLTETLVSPELMALMVFLVCPEPMVFPVMSEPLEPLESTVLPERLVCTCDEHSFVT